MAASDLTAQTLRELLDYNPETGEFAWAKSRVGAKKGSTAGTIRPDGYRSIFLTGYRYLAHRLAWLHCHGTWPSAQIDHISGDRADNRISNLREATSSINNQNKRGARSDNKASGLLGVYKNGTRWSARVQLGKAKYNAGIYDTPEEAHAAYIKAKRLMHPGCTI